MITIILSIVTSVFLVAMGIVLFFASVEDLKYRIIGKWKVIWMYLIAMIIVISTNNVENIYVSMTFLLSLVVFILVAVLSFGQFGIGDSLAIAACIWVAACFGDIRHYLLLLSIVTLVWACYWVLWLYRRNGTGHFVDSFRLKEIIHVSKLQVGMVLDGDNFMHGLKPEDIEELQNSGLQIVTVKNPIAYIPVIFISFLLFFIL